MFAMGQRQAQLKQQAAINQQLQEQKARAEALHEQERERVRLEQKRLELERAKIRQENQAREQTKQIRVILADAIAELDELKARHP